MITQAVYAFWAEMAKNERHFKRFWTDRESGQKAKMSYIFLHFRILA
nr:hypothetical protein P5648_19555 [Bacillus subtilis]